MHLFMMTIDFLEMYQGNNRSSHLLLLPPDIPSRHHCIRHSFPIREERLTRLSHHDDRGNALSDIGKKKVLQRKSPSVVFYLDDFQWKCRSFLISSID